MAISTSEAHNKGQTDRAEGNGYNPPASTWDNVCAVTVEQQSYNTSVNTAYNAGYGHTGDQMKDSK